MARLASIEREVSSPRLVLNAAHRDLATEQLDAVGWPPDALIVEPQGRNTAPAVALAALTAEADATLLIMPADHVIADNDAWARSVLQATKAASQGFLVTLGVTPSHPETGYGYIQGGDPQPGGFARVAQFVEKPDLATAQRYLEEQGYYWNSGMFVFRASDYLDQFRRFCPEMYEHCAEAVERGTWDGAVFSPEPQAFLSCPSDSIDYAVMERTADAAVVPLDAGWSDIGSWDAVYDLLEQSGEDNTVQGSVFTEGSRNNLVLSRNRPVAVIGAEGLIVVETEDAVLVVRRGDSQAVKAAAQALGKAE